MAELNADYRARVVVDTASTPWSSSPARGVWRKRLEHIGSAERGRVTSLVRYEAGSRFPSHEHPDGEEILVLDGVFSDERGDFPAGTYMLNPEGFSHAPFSETGCTLFVKLRQHPGMERAPVLVDTRSAEWRPLGIDGVESLELYRSSDHPEKIRLRRLAPRTSAPKLDLPEGEEIFVISGELEDELGRYPKGTWLRMPAGSSHRPRSLGGCLLYVKSGGFPVHHARVIEPAAFSMRR